MVRRVTTLLTVAGIALVVLIFESILGLARGIERAAAATGLSANVKVLRKGASAAESSALRRETCGLIKAVPGIALRPDGSPLAAEELLISVSVPGRGGGNVLIIVRGIDEEGPDVFSNVRVVRGTPHAPGGGVMIGRALVDQLGADVGSVLEFGRRPWTVNGVFEAGGAAYESEIWADLDDMMVDYKRSEVSAVTLRAASPGAAEELARRLTDDPALSVTAKTETKYYEDQSQATAQIRSAGVALALIMAVGAVFAGMNTMYATVAHRTREIGTLRALGYSRASILASFVIESVIIAAAAGLAGSAGALITNTIGLNMIGVGFRQIVVHFAVSPAIVAQGVVFSVAIGAIGGLLPARQAARLDVIRALRHI